MACTLVVIHGSQRQPACLRYSSGPFFRWRILNERRTRHPRGWLLLGTQDLIRRLDGVISTRVGYTGGDVPNATYRNHGTHAEAIEIIFDPTKSAIGGCSSSSSRSTTRRPSYRSASFYTSDEQKRIAKAAIAANSFAGFQWRSPPHWRRSCAGVNRQGGVNAGARPVAYHASRHGVLRVEDAALCCRAWNSSPSSPSSR